MGKQILFLSIILLFFIKFSFGQDNLSTEKQQEIVYKKLCNYRMPGYSKALPHLKQSYYTEASQIRILELLENKWSEEEIIAHAREQLRDTTYDKAKAKRITKKTGQSHQYILDSLLNDYLKDVKKYRYEESVNNELILTAGWLDDERYIEVLEKVLNDSLPKYNHKLVIVALARFKIEPYYTQTLNSNRINLEKDKRKDLDKKLQILLYIATQESLYEASKALFSEMDAYIFSEGPPVPYNKEAIAYFPFYINNLPYPFKGTEYYSEKKGGWIPVVSPFLYITDQDLVKVREWIHNNKGNYEINRSVYMIDTKIIK